MREMLRVGVPMLVGLAVLLIGYGLDTPTLHVWSGVIRLTHPVAAGLALFAAVASLILVAAASGLWRACGSVARLTVLSAGLPESAVEPVRAALVVGAAVVGLSVVLGSTVPARALTLLGAGVFAAFAGRRLLLVAADRRLGWRNRPGGLSGPQGGWELSEPFGLLLLFVLSLGLVIGLAQIDRPAPARPDSKSANERAAPGKPAPGTGTVGEKP